MYHARMAKLDSGSGSLGVGGAVGRAPVAGGSGLPGGGRGVRGLANSLAARIPGSGASRAPKSLAPGPTILEGQGGRLYSPKAYSDQSMISNYKQMISKGASPEEAAQIIQFATRASPQPRSMAEVHKILGIKA